MAAVISNTAEVFEIFRWRHDCVTWAPDSGDSRRVETRFHIPKPSAYFEYFLLMAYFEKCSQVDFTRLYSIVFENT